MTPLIQMTLVLIFQNEPFQKTRYTNQYVIEESDLLHQTSSSDKLSNKLLTIGNDNL